MELQDLSHPARTVKAGRKEYNIVAGNVVELEIAGIKELEETVPAGKKWTIHVGIDIIESNA